ncbi:MAG: helix-turn-helix transcriptional regulator [Clostridia bacterium]|nr:helix-turn-helix transcriptional regulator [Clostridia bacterium]
MGGLLNMKITRRRVSLAGASRYNIPVKYIDRVFTEHVLIYCLSGEYEIYDNDVPFTLKKDDVMFQHAGIHHYGLVPCKPDTAILFIHFGKCENDAYYPDFYPPPDGFEFLPTFLSAARHPTIKRIFQRVVDDWIEVVDERESQYHLKRLIEEIAHIDDESKAMSGKSGIVDRCLEIMKQNPERYFTTRDFSNLIFVSESTIRNVFRENMGNSLYAIQRDYKLGLVKSMLHDRPDMKLHEIAQATGYCDEYQMSKTFKKAYGMTPGQYRQQLNRSAGKNTEDKK